MSSASDFLRVIPLVLLAALASACGDGTVGTGPPLETGPSGRYALTTVNDRPLPYIELYGPATFSIESGGITFSEDGTFIHTYSYRISASGIVETGTETDTGVYSYDPASSEITLSLHRPGGEPTIIPASLNEPHVTVEWSATLRLAFRK